MKSYDVKNIIKEESSKKSVRPFSQKIIDDVSTSNDSFVFKSKSSSKKWFILIPSILIPVAAIVILIVILINLNTVGQLLSFEQRSSSSLTQNKQNLIKRKPEYEEVELDYSNKFYIVATVKNQNRYSFIDLVVYRSDLDTLVVYNEGNGKYQCSTETKRQDNMWVTIIEFEVLFNEVPDTGYLAVDSINFISSGNKQYTAGLSYAKSKEIHYKYKQGETHVLNSNLYDSANNLYLDEIDSGTIEFEDDVTAINIGKVDLNRVKFNNIKLYLNDNIKIINPLAEYLKDIVNVKKEDDCIYIPSKTNDYYALIDVTSSNAIVNENTKIVSKEMFDSKKSSFFKLSDNCYYLSSNTIEKFALINCKEDATVDYDLFTIKAGNLSCDKLIINNDSKTGFEGYDFKSLLFNGTLDEYLSSNLNFVIDGVNRTLYLEDSNGSLVVNNKKYSIPKTIFINCNLEVIPNYAIIDNVVIGKEFNYSNRLFEGCGMLENVYYDGSIEDWCKIVFKGSKTSNPMMYASNFYLKDTNGDITFNGNNYLAIDEITIPVSIEEIGSYQFYGFENIVTINISEGVKIIKNSCFVECSNLENISIPSSIESFGNSVFNAGISFKPGKIIYNEYNDDKYLGNDNNPYLVLMCSYNGDTSYEVNSNTKIINGYALKGLSSLENVVLPEGLISIGTGAFYGCSSLTTINIPSTVKNIGQNAFSYCSSLTNVVLPDIIESINIACFNYCDNLNYNLYDNAYYIGTISNPYYFLVKAISKNINTITIHSDTKIIGQRAFYGCSKINSIEVPEGVVKIGSYAFEDCTSLTSISLPKSLESISATGLFSNCESFSDITILNNITTIGRYMYSGCTSLKEIYIPTNIEEIDEYAFASGNSQIVIYIPNTVKYVSMSGFDEGDTIIYEGTYNEWKKITRFEPYFNSCTLICNDFVGLI